MFVFITSTGTTVVDEVEEQQCSTYLQAKSSSIGKAEDFFLGLSDTCKTGNVESDKQEKEEVFREIAQRSRSCWDRYGSGELDFMSNYDTTGKYCFPCTQMIFEEGDFEYDYREFIEWMQENRPEEEDKTYGELINFEYYDPTTEEFENITKSFQELEEELLEYQRDSDKDGSQIVDLTLYLSDYRTDLIDMKNRKITSGEPQYVVFKYQRVNNSLEEAVSNTIKGAGYSAAASLGTGLLIKAGLTGPIGLVATFVKAARTVNKGSKLYRVADKSLSVMNVLRKTKKSTKLIAAGSTGASISGGVVGANVNTNYNQYIEVVGEEEFYRTCGVGGFETQ